MSKRRGEDEKKVFLLAGIGLLAGCGREESMQVTEEKETTLEAKP